MWSLQPIFQLFEFPLEALSAPECTTSLIIENMVFERKLTEKYTSKYGWFYLTKSGHTGHFSW